MLSLIEGQNLHLLFRRLEISKSFYETHIYPINIGNIQQSCLVALGCFILNVNLSSLHTESFDAISATN